MAGIERSQAKTINLGLFYGMGKAILQAELGLSTKEEAEKLFEKYHSRVPFVKDLMNNTSRDSQLNGYIKTLLGRRCRFDTWEEAAFRPGRLTSPMTWDEAVSSQLLTSSIHGFDNELKMNNQVDVLEN